MDNPDFLIIGGGSAGAVIASRLSEDPQTRVLLVEAGRDTPPDALPADIADTFPASSLNPDYFWPGLQAVRTSGGPARPFPQARIMGGGSSVMGLWALRGVPSDFDAWIAAGAEGWSWADVLPYYRKLEDDFDRDQSQTSRGTYPIRRLPRDEWPAFVTAIEGAAKARGLPLVEDINERPGPGFFPMPLSQDMTTRASSARTYLTTAVRRRPNLKILTEAQVTALRFDGLRTCGATIAHGSSISDISAREVILCAGAIHSPAMLLRAGVGPPDELRKIGITPRLDRPGVGRNLQNHPYLHFALTLPRRSRLQNDLRRFAIAGARISSGQEEAPPADLLLFTIGRVSSRDYGTDVAMVGCALYAPYSHGAVSLASADAKALPRIDFRLLEDPRDPPRMLIAARFAESMLCSPGVAATYNDAFLLPPVMSLHQFNRPGATGDIFAFVAKTVLNAPAAVSRQVIGRVIRPGKWFANKRRRRELSDEQLLAAAAPMAHPVGTCSIGRPDNPMAVVDRWCRVYGAYSLRVADASIMPRIPSANTNLPTIMIAERISDLIRHGR
ncbi:MAG TPA: GMC family oxidoreductase N-terminal domain-containing protein [Pseudolabrys sp.]|nr:GMC family oxidoreductase N-terminal domain-containing protein [Pseudolabrys sp.]